MRDYTNYLVCAGCGKCLTGEEFTELEGKNYCETCEPIPVTPVETKTVTPAPAV